jgi:hypothetical protein
VPILSCKLAWPGEGADETNGKHKNQNHPNEMAYFNLGRLELKCTFAVLSRNRGMVTSEYDLKTGVFPHFST